ncbi:beta-lactamase family protein [Ligilactobacillus equi]|uniref:serine hydrolase domain-containing protein n=1 Tax=Ligilactobacillus equi TaxID=137357 RepID=UPI002ED3285C
MLNEKLSQTLHGWVREKVVPGVSYAYLKAGQMQSEVFGYSQIFPAKEILQPEMLYDLASLTKVVGTTTVIMHLVETKQVQIDDPVAQYLPKFKDKRVTLRHLLTHTSALTGYIQNRDELSAPDLLNALYTLEVGSWFEEKVVYADIGLILLGQIIESVYNQPVQTVIQEKVLTPLGMNTATFTPSPALTVPTELSPKRGLIRGQVHDPKAFTLGRHCGSAGLFATLTDLVKFSQWFLTGKNYGPGPVPISPTTIASFYQDWTPNGKLGRSLGWDLRFRADGRPALYHTGFTGTFLFLDQVSQEALIVLTNRIHPQSRNERFLLARDALIQEFFVNSK